MSDRGKIVRTYGIILREERKRRHLTLVKASALVGYSPSNISETELGHKDPRQSKLADHVEAYRIPMSVFCAGSRTGLNRRRIGVTTQTETLALIRAHLNHDDDRFSAIIRGIAEQAEHKAGEPTGYSGELHRLANMHADDGLRSNAPLNAYAQVTTVNDSLTPHRLLLDPDTSTAVDRLLTEWEARDRLVEHNLEPATRILLAGRPGTGKTSLAALIARRVGLPLVTVDLGRLIASKLGETGANVARLFDQADLHPCVLFLDEADALLARRDRGDDVSEMRRITNYLMQRIDSHPANGFLIAASNFEAMLDPAAVRRFQTHLTMPVADQRMAERLIRVRLDETRTSLPDDTISRLAQAGDGLAPAVILNALDMGLRDALAEDRDVDTETIIKTMKGTER